MASTFLNLSTDNTLGGNGASDSLIPSQAAVKSYIDTHSGGGGGTTYTAGDGIDITNNVISVDGVTTSEVTLATVATTGAYSDLTGTPTIPTTTSALTNDSGFITNSALSEYQVTSNLVTSVSSSSTDTQYPSAKCVYDIVGDIETLLSQV